MGNGDVKTPQDAKRMLTEVGADAVMIGRAALGNPWILKAVNQYLATGELITEPTPREKIIIAEEELSSLVKLKGEHLAVPEFRQQAAYYLKGIPRSARTKVAINEATTEAEVDQLLEDFVASYEARLSL